MSPKLAPAGESTLLPKAVVGVVFVGLVSVAFFLHYTDLLDEVDDGYCPVGNWAQEHKGFVIPGHTAILIDTSNAITPEAATTAQEQFKAWASALSKVPFLQKLSLYGLPETTAEIPKRSGTSWCIPMTGEEANPLYQDPQRVEEEFKIFLDLVAKEVGELIGRPEADQSPIVETMAHLAQEYEDLDSFLLVSDMLQHSPLADHYSEDTTLTRDARNVCARLRADGRLQSVWVVYIDRKLEEQSNQWPNAWWSECLEAVGVQTLN